MKEMNNLVCVKNADDLEYARQHYFVRTKILTHCQCCETPVVKTLAKIKNVSFDAIYCRSCGIKSAVFIKYGVANVFQLESVKDKSKETSLHNWGHEYPSKSDVFKDKVKTTCLQKYGVNNIMQSDHFKREARKTRYIKNDDSYRSKQEIIKQQETCLLKYGIKACWNRENTKERQQKTFNEKYGSHCFLHTEKYKEVMQERYGAVNPDYSDIINVNRFRKYYYDNNGFDSRWEIAYYIWLKDNNIEFAFHKPGFWLEYNFNDTVHRYYPDFILKDRIVEIKSPYLLKRMKTHNTLDEAKYICMLNNNVHIISDGTKYVKYVKDKYGNDFFEKCKKDRQF